MGLSLKRLVKGAVKLGKKVAPQILKATPLGQVVVRAQQTAKSLGVIPRAAKRKQEPVSVQAAIAKPALSVMSSRPQAAKRLRGSGLRKRDDQAYSVGAMLGKPHKSSRKAKRAPGKGRTAPAGGLDLKAIAAEWRRQGKPGRWIDFIKANPIRKAS